MLTANSIHIRPILADPVGCTVLLLEGLLNTEGHTVLQAVPPDGKLAPR